MQPLSSLGTIMRYSAIINHDTFVTDCETKQRTVSTAFKSCLLPGNEYSNMAKSRGPTHLFNCTVYIFRKPIFAELYFLHRNSMAGPWMILLNKLD